MTTQLEFDSGLEKRYNPLHSNYGESGTHPE
jgi:hypothetical protein